jgi:hypothetical protein
MSRKRKATEDLEGARYPVFLQSPPDLPPDPITVEVQEPVTSLVPTVQRKGLNKRFRFGPNIRTVIRRQLADQKKSLKLQLRECERNCKSLCNKKPKKAKRRTSKKKKNAKKGKK